MSTLVPLALMISLARAPDAPSPCDELMTALHTLRYGSFGERWRLLNDGVPHLQELVDEDDDLEECQERAGLLLSHLLRAESDDRIVARIMDAIDWDCDAFGAFPIDALSHGSSNVRRRAAAIITDAVCDTNPVPPLLHVWDTDSRPWVRSEVALALASEGDQSKLDEFYRLAVDDAGLLGEVALQAVGSLELPESVPFLEKIAAGNGPRAFPAFLELSKWRRGEFVADALRRLTESEDATVAQAAAALDPPAVQDVSSEEKVEKVVVKSNALARIIADPLQFEPERGLSFGSFVVSVGHDDHSVRCWKAPGYADPERIRPRIVDGTQVSALDLFEWGDETWYFVGHLGFGCWVPASALINGSAPNPSSRVPIEFDMSAAELALPEWRLAERAGFASAFDETDDVVAVRLSLATGDRDQIVWVLDLLDRAAGHLQQGLFAWLRENGQLWSGDEEIMARVAGLGRPSD